MKSLKKLLLASLVALSINPLAFASEAEPASSEKIETNLKTGNAILTEDIKTEPTNPATVKKEEPKVENPVDDKPAAEKPKEEKEVEKAQPVDKKTDEAKPAEVETKKPEVERNPVIYDYKTTENNKKQLEQQREAERKRNEEKAREEEANKRQQETRKANEEKSREISQLINEFDKFLTESAKTTPKPADKEIIKNVELVTGVVQSNKITKAESDKIATATKNIVEEYNKKIEAAPTEAKKNELRNEAVNKINQSIKETSPTAYNMIKESKESVKLEEQKNERLVLEIDVDGESLEKNDSQSQVVTSKKNKKTEAKSASLSRPPRLKQEPGPKSPGISITIVLIIVLVIAIAGSVALALKQRDLKK